METRDTMCMQTALQTWTYLVTMFNVTVMSPPAACYSVYARSKHAGCYVVPSFPIQAAAYLHTKLHGEVTELCGIDEFDANTLEAHRPKSRLRA